MSGSFEGTAAGRDQDSLPSARARWLAGVGLLAAFAAAAIPAAAHEFKAGELVIEHPWLRMPPPGATVAGGYLTIVNRGSAADRLVAVSSDVAGAAQLHVMTVEDGTMEMAELAHGIEIPAGATVELRPGSLHIMFMALTQPLAEGMTVPAELSFEKAGSVEVEFTVEPMGTTEPMEDHDMSNGADQ